LAIIPPVLGFFTSLLITPLQTYLAHLPIYWSSARSRIHSNN